MITALLARKESRPSIILTLSLSNSLTLGVRGRTTRKSKKIINNVMGLLELIQRVNEMKPEDFKRKKRVQKSRARTKKKDETQEARMLYRNIKEAEAYWCKNL